MSFPLPIFWRNTKASSAITYSHSRLAQTPPDHQTSISSDSDLNDYIRDAAQLPVARNVGVTILDGALKTLSEVSSLEEARVMLSEKTIKNLGFVNWTEGDSHKMDNAVGQMGDDLRGVRKWLPKKSGGDITKFFYMFKGCVR
jgi:hypothetical protein